jgi:hypothetical protein
MIATALAILFGAAAAHKARHAARFHAQLADYRLLPTALVTPVGWFLTVVEAGTAAALLAPGLRPWAGAVAVTLLLGYAGAIAINLLLRGRSHVDCGCGDVPLLLSRWLLIRNGLLAAGAATLTLSTSERVLTSADLAIALVGLPALLLAYRTVEQLLENASRLREWRVSGD